MTPDTSDIATRLRQTRADMLGTDDEQHYWDCHEAASHIELLEAAYKSSGSALAVIDGGFKNAVAEIQRLRLTDAEREAVERACCSLGGVVDMSAECTEWDADARLTLLSLLERMSGDGDCPQADNAADRDNAPPADATPDECTVPPQWTSRPYWVDPPSGHRYGFPKLYDPATDGDMVEWMIRNGYPKRQANQGLACTFTHCTEDVKK